MKIVLQRVLEARVQVDGDTVGQIEKGFVLLIGVGRADSSEAVEWLARKIAGLRVFADAEGKMNQSIRDVGGSCLAVSQFTLYGDVRKGTRPGFSAAAPAEEGRAGFEAVVAALRGQDLTVETGVFQADMQVELVNDGPVTLILERE